MIGMAKGMATTMRHLLRPAVTEAYPAVSPSLPPRSRMSFTLITDDEGAPQCKSCMLCAKSCPTRSITLDARKREDGPGRVLERFEIDLGTCMYCGICVESCTSLGLQHTGEFARAPHERADTVLVLYTAPVGTRDVVIDETGAESGGAPS